MERKPRPLTHAAALERVAEQFVWGGFCHACESPMAEGMQVGRVRLCFTCAQDVVELSFYKHSGDFHHWPKQARR